MRSLLTRLLAVVLVCGLCPFTAVGAQQEETKLRAKWGILLDLAGNDYVLSDGKSGDWAISFRWLQPGVVLEQKIYLFLGAGWASDIVYTATDEVGALAVSHKRRQSSIRIAKVSADGVITVTAPDGEVLRFSRVDGTKYKFEEGPSAASTALRGYFFSYKLAAKGTRSAFENRQKKHPLQPPLTMLASTSGGGTPANVAPPAVVASNDTPIPATPAPALPSSGKVEAVAAVRPIAGPRVALVVGNGHYTGSLGGLANPANDARLVAGALRAAGFDVELVVDADQRSMKQAISRLGNRAAKAGAGATALFYYAGHGIQSKGTNFLVPVGANLTNEADLELDAVAADAVLAQMETAGSTTNIVILDACRNMPLARATRSGTRGLARMDAPGGSFVAYSTAPGQEAIDGTGVNSPFATAFAAEIGKAGQPIQTVFQNVRQSVLQATDRKQRPWESSSLEENFYFRP